MLINLWLDGIKLPQIFSVKTFMLFQKEFSEPHRQ